MSGWTQGSVWKEKGDGSEARPSCSNEKREKVVDSAGRAGTAFLERCSCASTAYFSLAGMRGKRSWRCRELGRTQQRQDPMAKGE